MVKETTFLYVENKVSTRRKSGCIEDRRPKSQVLKYLVTWKIWLAAAAKSLQSCPTLCDPIDGSPAGSPIPGILKNTGVGYHFLLQCMKVKSESEVAQLCPTLRDPVDCSPPGSSVHGIFQARILEWGAIAFLKCDFTLYQFTIIVSWGSLLLEYLFYFLFLCSLLYQ